MFTEKLSWTSAFSIAYINGVPYSFENILADPFILPNGTKLSSLLYADDLIIL